MVESGRRIAELDPKSPDDIRNAGQPTIAFGRNMAAAVKELKEFLFGRMYRHYLVNRMGSKAKRVVTDLFDFEDETHGA